jgi:hypothetical protein
MRRWQGVHLGLAWNFNKARVLFVDLAATLQPGYAN